MKNFVIIKIDINFIQLCTCSHTRLWVKEVAPVQHIATNDCLKKLMPLNGTLLTGRFYHFKKLAVTSDNSGRTKFRREYVDASYSSWGFFWKTIFFVWQNVTDRPTVLPSHISRSIAKFKSAITMAAKHVLFQKKLQHA